MKTSCFCLVMTAMAAAQPWRGFAMEPAQKLRAKDEPLHVTPSGGIGATARGETKSGSKPFPGKGGPIKPSDIIPKPHAESAVKPRVEKPLTHLEHPGEQAGGIKPGNGPVVRSATGREGTAERKPVLDHGGADLHALLGRQPSHPLVPTMGSTTRPSAGQRASGLSVLGGVNGLHNKIGSGISGTGMTHRL